MSRHGQGRARPTDGLDPRRPAPRGKRRIHSKPNAREIRTCKPWLEAEIALVKPDVLVCLGATAAQVLLGPSFRVTRQRGVPVESTLARVVLATVHPSSLLRGEPAEREAAVARFVVDLCKAGRALKRRAA